MAFMTVRKEPLVIPRVYHDRNRILTAGSML